MPPTLRHSDEELLTAKIAKKGREGREENQTYFGKLRTRKHEHAFLCDLCG
jgi:hypothetical protein